MRRKKYLSDMDCTYSNRPHSFRSQFLPFSLLSLSGALTALGSSGSLNEEWRTSRSHKHLDWFGEEALQRKRLAVVIKGGQCEGLVERLTDLPISLYIGANSPTLTSSLGWLVLKRVLRYRMARIQFSNQYLITNHLNNPSSLFISSQERFRSLFESIGILLEEIAILRWEDSNLKSGG